MAKISNIQTGAAVRTASQEIIEEANRVVYETDSLGRTFGVRRVTMSMRRRLFKALSAESSEKTRYVNLCVVAASVATIDGEDVRFPTTEMQFDALIDRISDEGEAAIAKAYLQFASANGEDSPEDEAKN